jgi:iron complex transport system permease protein
MIISRSRFPVAVCALGMVLIALVALAISVGSFPVPLAKVVAVLWAVLTGGDGEVADNMKAVVLQVRAPRVIAALAVGAALASAGAAYQKNLFRNPLV